MANIHRLDQHAKAVTAITSPVTGTNDALANGDGAAIDTKGFTHALFIVSVSSKADGKATFGVKECATAAGIYSAVIANSTVGWAPAGAATNRVFVISVDCRKRLRYLKINVADIAGTVNGAVSCLLYNADFKPVVQAVAAAAI